MRFFLLFLIILIVLTSCERKKFKPKMKSAQYYIDREMEDNKNIEKNLDYQKTEIKNSNTKSNLKFEKVNKYNLKLKKAIVLKSEGKYYKAIELLLDVLEIDPENISILETLLETYRIQGDYIAVKKYAQRILQIESDNKLAILTLGNIYMKENNLDLALQYYNKLLKNSPNAEVYYNLGLLYFKKRNYNKAIKLFKQSLKLKNSSNTNYELALIYEKQNNDFLMLQYLENSIKTKDATSKSLLLLANKYIELNKYSEALKIFKKLTTIRDNNDDLKNLAFAYQLDKQYFKAIENYNQYLIKSPNNKDVVYNLALCYYNIQKANKLEETMKRYDELSGSMSKKRNLKGLLNKLRNKQKNKQ